VLEQNQITEQISKKTSNSPTLCSPNKELYILNTLENPYNKQILAHIAKIADKNHENS